MKHDGSALAASVPRLGMSLEKVAISLDISPTTVLKLVEEGSLPRPRVCGRRRIWRVAELDAALAEWPIDGEQEHAEPSDRWKARA